MTCEQNQIVDHSPNSSAFDRAVTNGHIIPFHDDRNSAPLPTVPVMLYVSNEPSNDEYWVGGMQAMVDASSDGTLIQLDCGHYVHNYAYERISQDMKAFIEKLNN